MAESRYFTIAASFGFQKSVIGGREKLDCQHLSVRHRVRQVGGRFDRRRLVETTEQSEHRLVHAPSERSRIETEIVSPDPLQFIERCWLVDQLHPRRLLICPHRLRYLRPS